MTCLVRCSSGGERKSLMTWWKQSLHRLFRNSFICLFWDELFPLELGALTTSTDQKIYVEVWINAGKQLQAFQTFCTITRSKGLPPPFSPLCNYFQIFLWGDNSVELAVPQRLKQTSPLLYSPPRPKQVLSFSHPLPLLFHPLLAFYKYLNHWKPHPS